MVSLLGAWGLVIVRELPSQIETGLFKGERVSPTRPCSLSNRTNAMTNRHFGELGDVWKYLPLAEVLRLNPPLHYWETHAGSAAYTLTESPTRRHGALRFLLCPGRSRTRGVQLS